MRSTAKYFKVLWFFSNVMSPVTTLDLIFISSATKQNQCWATALRSISMFSYYIRKGITSEEILVVFLTRSLNRLKKKHNNSNSRSKNPLCDWWDPPSLSPGPSSSGAALPPSLQSVESTRGQQTAKHKSVQHKLFCVLIFVCHQVSKLYLFC